MVLETTSSFSSVFKFWGFLGWDRIAKSEGGFIRNSQTYISVGLPVRVTPCGNRFVSSITDCRDKGNLATSTELEWNALRVPLTAGRGILFVPSDDSS